MKPAISLKKDTMMAKPQVVPTIPFERVRSENVSKDKYASFKLRSDPMASDSPTYEQAVRYFSDGTPEEWLLYLNAVQQVLTGQNMTTGPQSIPCIAGYLKEMR